MNTDTEPVPRASVDSSRKSVAPAKKRAVGAKPKTARAATTAKASPRPSSVAEKLVCRYCGSDDLAAVLQEAPRRPLPCLLQEALWLSPAGQEDRGHSEDEGREVVGIGSGLGSSKGSRPNLSLRFGTRSRSNVTWLFDTDCSGGRAIWEASSAAAKASAWRKAY
jgi:hypothetical protein